MTTQWIPSTTPLLRNNDLQVWSLYLPDAQQPLENYLTRLSPAEQASCERFKFEDLQRRYAVTRSVLRTLLAHYCQRPAEQIEILLGEHGKPYLADHALTFNLSHSGEYALFAFSVTRDILLGIDIERMLARDILSIAKRFFAADECAQLLRLPLVEQEAAFFRVWAQKEAFIKAIGHGLSYPLKNVSTAVTGVAALHNITDITYQKLPWKTEFIEVSSEYQACVTASQPWQQLWLSMIEIK